MSHVWQREYNGLSRFGILAAAGSARVLYYVRRALPCVPGHYSHMCTQSGRTPLLWAVWAPSSRTFNHTKVVKVLLKAGADPNIGDEVRGAVHA